MYQITMTKSYLHIVFILAVCFASTSLSTAQNSLIFRMNDGTGKGIAVSNLNKITFSAGNMVVRKTDASTENFVIANIQKMLFGIYSDVSDIKAEGTTLAVYPCPASNFIQLKNAPTGELNLTVFSMHGALLITQKLTSSSQQLDIHQLPNGLYLLKVNNALLKFVKQ